MKMKAIFAILIISLIPHLVCGGEKVAFETVKGLVVGESNGFSLTKENPAIIKKDEGSYLILQLVESIHEGNGKTYTEACTVKWIHVTPDGVESGETSGFERSKWEEIAKNERFITRIGGSDELKIADLIIRFSYGSSDRIYLYPSAGTKYATTAKNPEDSE